MQTPRTLLLLPLIPAALTAPGCEPEEGESEGEGGGGEAEAEAEAESESEGEGAPVCPNGSCEGGETTATCPADCGGGGEGEGEGESEFFCGDARCNEEPDTCPEDCNGCAVGGSCPGASENCVRMADLVCDCCPDANCADDPCCMAQECSMRADCRDTMCPMAVGWDGCADVDCDLFAM